ncbi:hypothetical protein SAMN05421823_11725 [Catalinimonas alkaloidigena]|uniref:DUF6249 domain-containing protein n=1 Tax=Catalinimonas alkaloidigena TaxID=1075417 RepID=A0A1G9UNI2_9BACT|nr:DUF6249 domain-containing protein [Catalinimonas alkaloidigena]SDM61480.1 hypothetical protein SAMN05421823_11725 [Catalinimonas alkaloidigena]
MNEKILALLIPISAVIGTFIVIINVRRFENSERLAMIERGMEPNLHRPANNSNTLRFALLAIGIGVGLILADLFESLLNLDGDVIYPAMLFLGGGVGLLLAYRILERKEKEREAELQKTHP